MKHPILLAGVAAGTLLLTPLAVMAQTSPATTNTPTANPKNADAPQCTQPAPGEAHVGRANCAKTAAPAPTKTLPKPKTKTVPAATSTAPDTTSPVPSADACPKPGSTAAPTPSNPQCDTNSGVHEGGPYGH